MIEGMIFLSWQITKSKTISTSQLPGYLELAMQYHLRKANILDHMETMANMEILILVAISQIEIIIE